MSPVLPHEEKKSSSAAAFAWWKEAGQAGSLRGLQPEAAHRSAKDVNALGRWSRHTALWDMVILVLKMNRARVVRMAPCDLDCQTLHGRELHCASVVFAVHVCKGVLEFLLRFSECAARSAPAPQADAQVRTQSHVEGHQQPAPGQKQPAGTPKRQETDVPESIHCGRFCGACLSRCCGPCRVSLHDNMGPFRQSHLGLASYGLAPGD